MNFKKKGLLSQIKQPSNSILISISLNISSSNWQGDIISKINIKINNYFFITII